MKYDKLKKFIKIIFLIWILFLGFFLRILSNKKIGRSICCKFRWRSMLPLQCCFNITNGIGPKTSFIFSYWFYHPEIPAYTDLYGPGYALF